MIVGWFDRCFNVKHKSLSTKTHIFNGDKVLCGYKPHKTMEFQWCVGIGNLDFITFVECDKCKNKFKQFIKKIKKENII